MIECKINILVHFVAKDNKNVFVGKLPNFIKVQSIPFDETYDEEKQSLQLVGGTNIIRWRYKRNIQGEIEIDEKGNKIKESNAKIVKWKNGSYQIIIGDDIFDAATHACSNRYFYNRK